MPSRPAISQAERWVRSRAKMVQMMKFSGIKFSIEDWKWGWGLYIQNDLVTHPYRPGSPGCEWYIQQVEFFIQYIEQKVQEGESNTDYQRFLRGDLEPIRSHKRKKNSGYEKVSS